MPEKRKGNSTSKNSKKSSSPKKRSASAGRKKNTPKRSRRRSRKKSSVSVGMIAVFFALLLIGIFVAYTLFVFPKMLNKNIKRDLISLYDPVLLDDNLSVFIIKLSYKPSFALNKSAYDLINKKYGLAMKYDKISSAPNNGINKISFYKNDKEYNDISPVYIFWDSRKYRDYFKEKRVENNDKSINYEKIEEKRKNERRERLEHPNIAHFQPVKKDSFGGDRVKIAIVIDDVGYSYNSTYDFLSLGFPVTFALIPDMPQSDKFYNLFKEYGYELILHIPMEPLKGRKYVESNGIFTDMDENEIQSRVRGFIDRYPGVMGANNHMGSKAVLDARVMNSVLGELSARNKLWLDSMTNDKSITKEVASILDLEYYERDVFLDNNKDRYSIKKSIDNLIKEAKQKGKAIGIGHIQTGELVPVLKEYYEKREELGIEFVPLSKL